MYKKIIKNISFLLFFIASSSSYAHPMVLTKKLQNLQQSMNTLSLKLTLMNKNLDGLQNKLSITSTPPSPEDTFKESPTLSEWEIQQKITAAGDKLKKLVLKNRNLTTLDCSQNINLEEIYAENCKNLNKIHGLSIEKFKKLTTINCPLQNFAPTSSFFFNNLESLTLQNNLIKTSFDCLLYKKINELSLVGCSNITAIYPKNTIKKLNCTDCINLQECSIMSLRNAEEIIFKNCKNLTAIKSDFNENDDVFKQTINLKKIDFTGCSELILSSEEKKTLKILKTQGCLIIGINLD